jgi:hypothetical protein
VGQGAGSRDPVPTGCGSKRVKEIQVVVNYELIDLAEVTSNQMKNYDKQIRRKYSAGFHAEVFSISLKMSFTDTAPGPQSILRFFLFLLFHTTLPVTYTSSRIRTDPFLTWCMFHF